MNKTLLSAALIAGFGVAALAPPAAHAASASGGTITFTGSITTSTCAVTVGGSNTSPNGTSATATVTLPNVVAANTTLTTAGSSAGWTSFTLNLSGCPNSLSGYTKVYPYFTGTGIDTTTGYLTNTGTANSNVEVALSNTAATGATALTLGGASGAQNAGTTAISSTASSFTYYAGYVATAVPVLPGAVTATVQYNLNYQ